MKIRMLMLCGALLMLAACSGNNETKTISADASYDPKTMCPVSGEKLGGDMGPPYVMDYNGRKITLCCSNCEEDFRKDPQKYLSKLDGTTTKPAAK